MADEAQTFMHEGKEYTFAEIEKILGQHERAAERRKDYQVKYDPEKAKIQRDRRMEALKADPEKWALYESYQKAMREKRAEMLKACKELELAKRIKWRVVNWCACHNPAPHSALA